MPATATTPSSGAERDPPDRPLILLWIGVLLPPASWILDLLTRYGLIRNANIHDRHWPLTVATAVCVALLLVGAGLCWRARRQGTTGERATLAAWGLAMAAFFLLLILAQAFPVLVIGPREIT